MTEPRTAAGHRHSWDGVQCRHCGLTRGRESKRNADRRAYERGRAAALDEARAAVAVMEYPDSEEWDPEHAAVNAGVDRALAAIDALRESRP